MALARGRFGIEYSPELNRGESPRFGMVVVAILLLAAVSFGWYKVRAHFTGTRANEPAAAVDAADSPKPNAGESAEAPSAPAPAPAAPVERKRSEWIDSSLSSRPLKVKNLLLRLDEAETLGNTDMIVDAIEQLRALPGEPAADLDDRLAKRLGGLNLKRLFDEANAQWVAEIEVKKRDSASRIAFEHGSTLASLVRLNPAVDVKSLRPGMKLKVMKHPRFSLTVHRRALYADLNLNGRFFRRYEITSPVKGAVGSYSNDGDTVKTLRELGLEFSPADRKELATLMPKSATIALTDR